MPSYIGKEPARVAIVSDDTINAAKIIDGTVTGADLASDITISTTGSITSSGLTVDTDVLYVDSTNNRVGIGTTSPTAKLEIKSATGVTNARLEYTGTRTALQFSKNGTVQGALIAETISSNDMIYIGAGASYGSNPVLAVDATNQRVGIGTTSPSTNLHISGTGTPSIQIQDSDGTNQTVKVENSSGVLRLYARNDTSDGQLIFYGEGGGTATEKFRIDTNGKVGIGTASPTQALTVFSSSSVLTNLIPLPPPP